MSDGRATLHTDGGARGNPGPAGIGFVLTAPDGAVVSEGGRYLGETTNNVAEYQALIWGLENALSAGYTVLDVASDSELVVRQLNGEYKVKNQGLKPLFLRALELMRSFDDIRVRHIDREQNRHADALANEAMDAKSTIGPRTAAGTTDVTASAAAPAAARQACLFEDSSEGPDLGPGPGKGVPMYELTVKGHFDAAHTLEGYPGECSQLHGHTWDVEVTVAGETLDSIGIVYDFKDLKDDLASVLADYDHVRLNDVAPFDQVNPTAENLARVICERLSGRVADTVTVKEVAVWESPVARLVYRP